MNLLPLFFSGAWSLSVRVHYTTYSTWLPIPCGTRVRLRPRCPQPASHPPPLRLLPAGPHPTVLTLYSLLQGGCLTFPWFPVPVPWNAGLSPRHHPNPVCASRGLFTQPNHCSASPARVLHLAFDTRALSNLEPAQGEHVIHDCGMNEFTLQGLAPLPCL